MPSSQAVRRSASVASAAAPASPTSSRSTTRTTPASSCTQQPTTRVPLDEEQATKLMRLIDALEDNDDVGDVHANFDVDADVLERVAG